MGSEITKKGTRSVPTTFLDSGQAVFPHCIICPSLMRRARKDIIPKRRNFTRRVRSAKIRQTTIS